MNEASTLASQIDGIAAAVLADQNPEQGISDWVK